ncbi:hypothetical protein TOPH_09077 [Tolypocladium ophioglossoides CBS 100239]|uniref:Uncharacterized protein n=1 Tax=Tolypocladium ophioglossoides (strain CBS 100239) TaxID=1163406 RepID=A0A0L0MWX4_TOLOC|nr:hypothetical protein TOPH_09077 [Tolypocladium ophioglossoides CBS 100239]
MPLVTKGARGISQCENLVLHHRRYVTSAKARDMHRARVGGSNRVLDSPCVCLALVPVRAIGQFAELLPDAEVIRFSDTGWNLSVYAPPPMLQSAWLTQPRTPTCKAHRRAQRQALIPIVSRGRNLASDWPFFPPSTACNPSS